MEHNLNPGTLWFCRACTVATAGIDETIVDQCLAAAVEAGMARLAAIGDVRASDPAWEDGMGCEERSRYKCDCCGTTCTGLFHAHTLVSDTREAQ